MRSFSATRALLGEPEADRGGRCAKSIVRSDAHHVAPPWPLRGVAMGSSTVARKARARLRALAAKPQGRPAAIFLFAVVLLLAGSGGHAQQAAVAQGSLSYFKAYFGNFGHVVGGVGLSGTGNPTTGLATGT